MIKNNHLKNIFLAILIAIFIACLYIPIEISLSEYTDRVRVYDILVLAYWFAPLVVIPLLSVLLILLLIRKKQESKKYMKKTLFSNVFSSIIFWIEYCVIVSISFIVIRKCFFFSSIFWFSISVGILQGLWWLLSSKLVIHFMAYLINIYISFYLCAFIQGKDLFTTKLMETGISIGVAPFALTIIPTVFSIFCIILIRKNYR